MLEVILGIGIASLVLTGIYSTAVGCLRLSQKITEHQQSEMHMHSFLGVMRRNVEGIPGNAKISMEPPEGLGGVARSEIVLEDYPLAFSWAGVPAGSKRVLIISDKDPRGGTRIRIRYLSAEEAEAHAEGGAIDEEGLGITLIDGLKSVWWRFLNQRTLNAGNLDEAWEEDWVRPNERPSLVEMNIEFYDSTEDLRAVFWVPVVLDPATVVRGVQTGSRPGGGSSGGGRGGVVRPPGSGGGASRSSSGSRPRAQVRPSLPGGANRP